MTAPRSAGAARPLPSVRRSGIRSGKTHRRAGPEELLPTWRISGVSAFGLAPAVVEKAEQGSRLLGLPG
jgi:hypothetical protein